MHKKYYALILAGGEGKRMKKSYPKQFFVLQQKPILMHTLEAFYTSSYAPEIVLVLHSKYYEDWKDLCRTYEFKVPHHIIAGGDTRFESVKNGLEQVPNTCIVAVHDGVRPIINHALISQCYQAAELTGNAIPAIACQDSVRYQQENTNVALDRNRVYLIQTPQVFKAELLKGAYQQGYEPCFTDDASVVEKFGFPIFIIPGCPYNLKITQPIDLLHAECFLKAKKQDAI